jgi:hypothetical protein
MYSYRFQINWEFKKTEIDVFLVAVETFTELLSSNDRVKMHSVEMGPGSMMHQDSYKLIQAFKS